MKIKNIHIKFFTLNQMARRVLESKGVSRAEMESFYNETTKALVKSTIVLDMELKLCKKYKCSHFMLIKLAGSNDVIYPIDTLKRKENYKNLLDAIAAITKSIKSIDIDFNV
jgi:hypothetical protein